MAQAASQRDIQKKQMDQQHEEKLATIIESGKTARNNTNAAIKEEKIQKDNKPEPENIPVRLPVQETPQ
jgi:hypothetical protein